MASSEPLMYAELLSNIRQISVIVALDTQCDSSTRVSLSGDGRQIVLLHDGKTHTLILPGQVAPDSHLQKLSMGSKELSFRLPLAGGQSTRGAIEEAQSSEAPWSARVLGLDTEFACRNCGAIILRRGVVKTWKDLPSENWAEMMDFWHCHKPDIPAEDRKAQSDPLKSDENEMSQRGYGANSKFAAQTGVGFVDITSFLLTESDCQNMTRGKDQKARCTACSTSLGTVDLSGVKLFKWTLKQSSTPQTPPLAYFLTSQFAAILSSQLVSKLLLMPASTSTSSTIIFLWILTPFLRYSSTYRSDNSVPSMKVFWRRLKAEEAASYQDNVGVEELVLPENDLLELDILLRDSGYHLPKSARKFKEWDVGLLGRWEE